MKEQLWKFTDDKASFASDIACRIKTIYFPLCNSSPIMSSVTPDLHGDLKTDFNSFLLEPVSRSGLQNIKSSRNFWAYINPEKIWSLTGVSKDTLAIKEDKFKLEAGLLWQKITRENKAIGLKAEITSFVPGSGEPIELMAVEIANISKKPVKFIPTAAIPIFARSAHNLHDHRHVTSLLQRIEKQKYGVAVTPTLVFDESGHRKNSTSYFVLGIDEKYGAPEYIYPTQEEFTGEDSDLEYPKAVVNNLAPVKNRPIQGKETMAGLKFKACLLKPKQSASHIIILGIVKDKARIKSVFEKFNTPAKVHASLEETKSWWQKKSSQIQIKTHDSDFDNWLRWVSIQPFLRKIFGCSFLPDFDYGKGGRGWRDLWQDCLSLILNSPEEVKPLLINNFSGVRIDGSNATIIGAKPGEFIADRNNISRVWMDHGIWPLLTTHLYLHQTGDLKIILEETPYFYDYQLRRGRERNPRWDPKQGKNLKTKKGDIYQGTILEHLLIQNLVQFFNVGSRNNIRLEGADWNDGLDMAKEHGESVAFSAMYAQNLNTLAEVIERLGCEKIVVLEELSILFDFITDKKIDYSDAQAKNKLLEEYFQNTKYAVSGRKISLKEPALISDLKRKADWLSLHIRKNEWLKEGFFNGYYNNDQQRVEGKFNGLTRMTLAGQVFPVTSGIATDEQIRIIFKSAQKYLKDKELGGFRLNTDFKDEQLNLGRAFSFIYGDKENGAFFNHICVMFAYALYKRGFVREGSEVLNSIYRMAIDTQKSKIYPGLPEYFNDQGRGMYSYLTGSASWFVLTLLTEVFGVKGEYGDLVIEPKLSVSFFKSKKPIRISALFAGKPITVEFSNPQLKDFSRYSIRRIVFNKKILAGNLKQKRFLLLRKDLLKLSGNNNLIEITLG